MKTDAKTESTPATQVETGKQEESNQNGTTGKLFPDFVKTAEPKVKAQPVETKENEEKPKESEATETKPKVETEPEPEYLTLEAFADKKVKVKIDGEEKEITYRDLIKGYQTDQYLTRKGQRVAEEYRQLQTAKAVPKEIPSKNLSTATQPEEDEFYREYIKPHVVRQSAEMEALRSELKTELVRLQGVTGPIQYQNNVKKVAADMKTDGYDDFLKYVPEIENRILNMPVEQQATFDTDWGYKSIYKDMKLAEFRAAMSKPASKPIVTVPVEGRPVPKLVTIEGGGGGSAAIDDSASQYEATFKNAKLTGDFTEVLRLKGAI